jgi:opacity protein-like surface antigen
MTTRCIKAGLALATALLAATPASATDLAYSGGIKDGRSGVPVPAPMPVYETFRWYLRADVGLGWQDATGVHERGMRYGVTDSGGRPFGMDRSWFQTDFDTMLNAGAGFGLYLSPRWRGDVTVDLRSQGEVNTQGRYSYAEYPAAPPPIPTGNTIRGTTVEHTTVRSTVGLANVYYDLTDRGRFTPYIGLGAGMALRYVDRRHETSEERYNAAGLPTGLTRHYSGNAKTSQLAPAAAATVGASYAVSTGVLLDFNYRYTWLGSVDNTIVINGNQSRVTVGDTHEHALRAGVRWNVW